MMIALREIELLYRNSCSFFREMVIYQSSHFDKVDSIKISYRVNVHNELVQIQVNVFIDLLEYFPI